MKLFSETDPIPGATTVNITIHVLYDCDPFQGAEVEMTHLYGAVSTITDEGNGKFTFSYLAPSIGSDALESFTVTGKKDGYGELTRTFNITIKANEKSGTRTEAGEDDALGTGGGGDGAQNHQEGEGNGLTPGDDLGSQKAQDSHTTGDPNEQVFGGHFPAIIVSAGSMVLLLTFLALTVRTRKRHSD